jgi:hypothetical protein
VKVCKKAWWLTERAVIAYVVLVLVGSAAMAFK